MTNLKISKNRMNRQIEQSDHSTTTTISIMKCTIYALHICIYTLPYSSKYCKLFVLTDEDVTHKSHSDVIKTMSTEGIIVRF